jgi:hypothetical protein
MQKDQEINFICVIIFPNEKDKNISAHIGTMGKETRREKGEKKRDEEIFIR